VFSAAGSHFRISYTSGTGNDVVLTVPGTISWDNGAGTFNWTDTANWSSNMLPGPGDDVIIPDLPGTPTITVGGGIHRVASVTSNESFTLSGGALTVDGTLSFIGTFTHSGGTLKNATVDGPGTAIVQLTSPGGTLDGVTLSLNTTVRQGTQAVVLNGLTLANDSVLRLERPTNCSGAEVGLNFSGGAQLLGGMGTVEMSHNAPCSQIGVSEGNVRIRPTGAGSSLTIGPGITVRNVAGSELTTLGDPLLPLIIQGSVLAQSSGRTLRVTGSTVISENLLKATAGTLQVAGTTVVNQGHLHADGGAER
jgi:hypothetical protein